MAIQKVQKASVSDQVFRQMQEQILEGAWKPGEKIPSENELAELFGVSRVTVRNALQKLAALGLLETRFGEGSFVREAEASLLFQPVIPAAYLGNKKLEEILQFRWMVEGPVCEEACRLAGPEATEELGQIYREMEKNREDLSRFARYDYQFHLKLAEITGNSILTQMYRIINDVMENAFDRIVLARGSAAGLHYHGEILKAFQSGDAQKAGGAMREHMRDLWETYCRGGLDQDEK